MRNIILIFLIAFLSCTTKKMVSGNQNQSNKMTPQFDKQGHRGCRGLMPENTIPAMIRAIELGVTTLEMDAQITKDRQVLISHDPYFNHQITTKPDGKGMTAAEEKNYVIYKMDYLETMSFDVGMKPNPKFPDQQKMPVHKPLLSDLIDSVENYCKREKKPLPFYNIETKCLPSTDNIYHPPPTEFVELLMEVIQSKDIQPRVIIQSFDPRTLVIVNQKYPGIRTALLIEGYDKRSLAQQINQLGFTPTIYSPEYTLVTDSLVIHCHGRNMKIIPWTVNQKKEIEKLTGEGVDGIITDFPNLF